MGVPGGVEGTGGTRDWTEVRLLGPLRVRRPDGVFVQDRDWRTGKNADLLRWLALQGGAPVPVDTLVDGLWPGADEARGRSSLRTAVAQLRRVLGPGAVDRVAAGLVLTGAWVDALAFLRLAEDVDRHRRTGRHAEAFAAALEAEALYVGDMPVGETSPEALAEHANALRAVHLRLLGDAAEAALDVGWSRDAADFARRLLDADPVAERASRVLMLAHAEMGEVHKALHEFERFRKVLADELGVDPSPQTRAAHLKVLQPVPAPAVEPPLVGREDELAWLRGVLSSAAAGGGSGAVSVVVLRGAPGSGRRRLTADACRDLGLDLVVAGAGTPPDRAAATARGGVLLWRPAADTEVQRLVAVLTGAATLPGPVATVVALPGAGELPAVDEALSGDTARVLELPALLVDDTARLAAAVLGAPPRPSLLEELERAGAGLPGRVIALVGEWGSTGRLAATSQGIAMAPRPDAQEQDQSGRRALAKVLPRLDGDALEVLQLAALLDQAVTPALLAPLLPETAAGRADRLTPRARATTALEHLVDTGVLRSSAAGAVWRHPLLQDAVRAWTRPAAAQRLHRRIAMLAPMPSAARVDHWLKAGERELACVAALEAAEECSVRGDHAGARCHLLEVLSLGDLPEAAAEDRADLFESLGDACSALRRSDEAQQAYRQALDLALAGMLPQAARLRRKLDRASDPRALELVPRRRRPDQSSALTGFGATTAGASGLPALEAHLRDAVEEAERRHDQRRSVEARLQLAAAVALPRRDFRGVHTEVQAALARDPRPVDRLRAVLVQHLTPVLLGGAAAARPALERAARAAEDAREDVLWWHLLGMRVLVAHDLGDPAFDALFAQLEQRVTGNSTDELVPELAVVGLRVQAEREELDGAVAMSSRLALAGSPSVPPLSHLARLASCELAAAFGDHRHAADLARSVVEDGTREGSALLVPEAAARLVVLEAQHDPDAARNAFDVYDDVVGATVGGPREEYWRRLARGAMRAAQGDLEGAAAACTQAGQLAMRHGLQVLAARARQTRSEYLRAMAPRRVAADRPPGRSVAG